MKILSVVIAVALFGGGGYFWFLSGSPRADVAKKKVMDKIDDMLGKIDVQRAEIDQGIKAAKQGVEGVRKAKIKAQVQVDQLDEKVKPYDEQMARCDQSLVKLRDLIKADTAADIAGKSYSVAELKEMANKVIEERKKAEGQINGFKATRENMKKLVATLAKRQDEFDTKITTLQASLVKVDAEMTAAKALKQASAAMGDKDSNMSSNLADLEQKIAALSADVRVELQGASGGWSETEATKSINDVEAFIRNTQSTNDTVAEIDRILGPAKK